ncbi:hypothetical protein JTB14_036188 [Gonioctena quinquepunctata]|nr:hypothetical protein JTB14_036188 [Gonioctena quinquepunctata]
MVHKNSALSNIVKFNYLIASLKGPPASLVQTLPLSSDNYLIASDDLIEIYSNKRLRSHTHWTAIESVPKSNRDNLSSLRNLLDVFSENFAALQVMDYPVDQWDFILTMMMLKKLDNVTITRFDMEHRSSDMPTHEEVFER